MNNANIIIYLISLSITTVVYVYILHLPERLSGANDLVKHYYYDNGIKNFIFDVFLVYIYISIARFFMKRFKINSTGQQIAFVSICTCIISTCFMFLFSHQKNGFFTSWFHKARFNAVIYDIILVTTTYALYSICI